MNLGFWLRIALILTGIMLLNYTILGLLCFSGAMTSASLRLVRVSHPGSLLHRLTGLLNGLTLTIILGACLGLFAAYFLENNNAYELFLKHYLYKPSELLVIIFGLIAINTIVVAINVIIQFQIPEHIMKNQFDDKTIFMTGGTSGLGQVAAIHALANGAHLILMARNIDKAEKLKATFKKDYPKATGKLTLIEGDLNSLISVAAICNAVKEMNIELDMLVLNAGIMNFKRKQSMNEIEETLQVNLLAPFLIINELYDLLVAGNSKVILTSSGLHKGSIQFDDIEFKESYSAFKVYSQSKLGVILLSRLLAEKLKKTAFYSQHPGVVKTELGRDAGWFSKMIFSLMGKSPAKGAQTLIHLMESENSELENGAYYANNKVTKSSVESYDMPLAERLLAAVKDYLKPYMKQQVF